MPTYCNFAPYNITVEYTNLKKSSFSTILLLFLTLPTTLNMSGRGKGGKVKGKSRPHRGVIRSNHYYCGSSPKCEADRCIVTGTGQSALSLLLYHYLQNYEDRCIRAGTGQTVLSLLLYTYLLHILGCSHNSNGCF